MLVVLDTGATNSLIRSAILTSVGYELGSSYRHVLKAFSDAGYVLGALFVVAVVVLFVHRLRVVRAERPEQP